MISKVSSQPGKRSRMARRAWVASASASERPRPDCMMKAVVISTICRTFLARLPRPRDLPRDPLKYSRSLLYEPAAYGGIRNDSPLREQVAAAAAAGPQPLFIQPQEIGVRG